MLLVLFGGLWSRFGLISSLESPMVAEIMAEIWSDFGFCSVVFESLVVNAIVFLGFVVNLWVSVGLRFWVLW